MRPMVAIAFLLVANAATAQVAPPDPGISTRGHIVTKKALADCKRQARSLKLNYVRRRAFVRKCVEA